MADDITNGELARRLDDLKGLVGDLVGRPEYEADQRGDDRRFADIGRDIGAIREQHDRDIKAVHARIDNAEQATRDHRMSWRTVIYTGVIPAGVVLVAALLQIWAMHSGGH